MEAKIRWYEATHFLKKMSRIFFSIFFFNLQPLEVMRWNNLYINVIFFFLSFKFSNVKRNIKKRNTSLEITCVTVHFSRLNFFAGTDCFVWFKHSIRTKKRIRTHTKKRTQKGSKTEHWKRMRGRQQDRKPSVVVIIADIDWIAAVRRAIPVAKILFFYNLFIACSPNVPFTTELRGLAAESKNTDITWTIDVWYGTFIVPVWI